LGRIGRGREEEKTSRGREEENRSEEEYSIR
jgi:hypothetical protein